MSALALRNEAISLINRVPEYKMTAAIRSLRRLVRIADEEAARKARDEHDIAVINANAAYLNQGAEENLEFQADIWEDDE